MREKRKRREDDKHERFEKQEDLSMEKYELLVNAAEIGEEQTKSSSLDCKFYSKKNICLSC